MCSSTKTLNERGKVYFRRGTLFTHKCIFSFVFFYEIRGGLLSWRPLGNCPDRPFLNAAVYKAVCGGRQGIRQNWNVHQLLQRLKNVDVLDGVSQNSAEDGSNTDSGRGASEPDAVAAGGTAEHNGAMTRQQCSSLQTDGRVANLYGQSVATSCECNYDVLSNALMLRPFCLSVCLSVCHICDLRLRGSRYQNTFRTI